MDTIRRLFYRSDTPNITENNSVISIIGSNNEYLPIFNLSTFTLRQQFMMLIPFSIIWIFMVFITFRKEYRWTYLIGFGSGLILMIVNILFQNSQTRVYVDKDDLQSYAFNVVPSKINKDSLVNKGSEQVILNENTITVDEENGYLVKYNEFKKKLDKNNNIVNMGKFMDDSFRKDVGYGRQDDPIYHSEISEEASNTSFYLAILCITLAIYVNRNSWKGAGHLTWIVSSVIVSLITMGFSFGKLDSTQQSNIIFIKRQLILVAASFTITAILISANF